MNTRIRKFFSYYQPYRRLLLADLACAFIVAVATLLFPLCTRAISQTILQQPDSAVIPQIIQIAAFMLLLVIVQTLCNMFVDYQGHMMGALMESDMRLELFAHYQKLSFGFYDERKTGELMTHITHDLLAISELFHHGPEDFAIAAFKFLGAFIILITINVELTLIVFAFLPLMAVYALYFHQRMTRALRHSHDRIGDVNAQVEDTLSGIRVVKSFGNEAIEQEKFRHENQRFVDSRREGYRSESYFSAGLIAFTQVITVAVVIYGGIGMANSTLDAADLVTFLMCVAILIDPVMRLVNITRLFQEGLTGYDRFMDMLEIAPDITDLPNAVELTSIKGHIEFEGVSFKYHEDHDYLLNNISLNIGIGEYIALVGTSGVGKTTLCSLISRFYDVTEGAVRIDGHDVRDVTLSSLRRGIGVVQQDVYLFAGTVAENICYGRMDAAHSEIVEAARKANAHEFIMQLPNGYQTDIGQRGVKLSGGQKQRLSIARVFLKDPPVLILDEATSALDNENERAIQSALEYLTRTRTTIVIAHRLSTIRSAHRILVLTEHGIEEQGTHDMLIAHAGIYARLYNQQS